MFLIKDFFKRIMTIVIKMRRVDVNIIVGFSRKFSVSEYEALICSNIFWVNIFGNVIQKNITPM